MKYILTLNRFTRTVNQRLINFNHKKKKKKKKGKRNDTNSYRHVLFNVGQ